MNAATSLLYRDEPLYTEYRYDSLYADLNIDQILSAVTEDLDEYRLNELYRRKPLLIGDVEFRQAVAGDLLSDSFRVAVERALGLLSQTKRYAAARDAAVDPEISAKWHLDAAHSYCGAVDALTAAGRLPRQSEGWSRLFTWLGAYTSSVAFTALREDSARLTAAFDECRFEISVDLGNEILVLGGDTDGADLLGEYLDVFTRFDLSSVRREVRAFPDTRMNSLEVQMLTLLKDGHPELFASLRAFGEKHGGFFHENLTHFMRHAWFYLSYLRYVAKLEKKKLPCSFPHFKESGGLCVRDGYDLAFAQLDKTREVVFNDLLLDENERLLILTGPNQGGKTTFTRMLGQILFFACAGLPVCASQARLPFIDDIRTHFVREETAGSQSGRLQDELLRLKPMLGGLRKNSVLLMNELFSSTTTFDACEMGGRLLESLRGKNCLCLLVTHVYELAYAGRDTVSLVAETESDENGEPRSTFRIVRGSADGAAYAARLLRKYRLTKKDIEVRKHAAFTAMES